MITVPEEYNYIGCFLTLKCNLNCSYCINHIGGSRPYTLISAKQWTQIINGIQSPNNIPITLQGGEPTTHPEFFSIMSNLVTSSPIHLLTNLQFNIKDFIQKVPKKIFNHNLPYPAIRVTYHAQQMDLKDTLEKIRILDKSGYNIGLYYFNDSLQSDEQQLIDNYRKKFKLTIKIKKLLGKENTSLDNIYKYPDAVFKNIGRECRCKTSELLISPDGSIYKCHFDLYNQLTPIYTALKNVEIKSDFRRCNNYGKCNPCDIKIKNNRFQKFGHCSVEIITNDDYNKNNSTVS